LKVSKKIEEMLKKFKYSLRFEEYEITLNFLGEDILSTPELITQIVKKIKEVSKGDICIRIYNKKYLKYLNLEDYISTNEYLSAMENDYHLWIDRNENDNIQKIIEDDIKYQKIENTFEKKLIQKMNFNNDFINNSIQLSCHFNEELEKEVKNGMTDFKSIYSKKKEISCEVHLFGKYNDIRINTQNIGIALEKIGNEFDDQEITFAITTTQGKYLNGDYDIKDEEQSTLKRVIKDLEIKNY